MATRNDFFREATSSSGNLRDVMLALGYSFNSDNYGIDASQPNPFEEVEQSQNIRFDDLPFVQQLKADLRGYVDEILQEDLESFSNDPSLLEQMSVEFQNGDSTDFYQRISTKWANEPNMNAWYNLPQNQSYIMGYGSTNISTLSDFIKSDLESYYINRTAEIVAATPVQQVEEVEQTEPVVVQMPYVAPVPTPSPVSESVQYQAPQEETGVDLNGLVEPVSEDAQPDIPQVKEETIPFDSFLDVDVDGNTINEDDIVETIEKDQPEKLQTADPIEENHSSATETVKEESSQEKNEQTEEQPVTQSEPKKDGYLPFSEGVKSPQGHAMYGEGTSNRIQFDNLPEQNMIEEEQKVEAPIPGGPVTSTEEITDGEALTDVNTLPVEHVEPETAKTEPESPFVHPYAFDIRNVTNESVQKSSKPKEKTFVDMSQADINSIVERFGEDSAMRTVKDNPAAFRWIPQTFRSAIEAVKTNGLALEFVKKQNFFIQRAAVQQNGLALGFIKNPNKFLQVEAIKQNFNAIFMVKNPSKTAVLLAIKEAQSFLASNYEEQFKNQSIVRKFTQRLCSEKYGSLNQHICNTLIKIDPSNLAFIPEQFVTSRMCRQCMDRMPSVAADLVPLNKWNDKLKDYALKVNPLNVTKIPNPSMEQIGHALSQDKRVFDRLPESVKRDFLKDFNTNVPFKISEQHRNGEER